MKPVYSRCAGLDLHRDTVHVAVRKGRGKTLAVDKQVFGTDMASLVRLRKYLRERGSRCRRWWRSWTGSMAIRLDSVN
jgi:hypothetical protein